MPTLRLVRPSRPVLPPVAGSYTLAVARALVDLLGEAFSDVRASGAFVSRRYTRVREVRAIDATARVGVTPWSSEKTLTRIFDEQ